MSVMTESVIYGRGLGGRAGEKPSADASGPPVASDTPGLFFAVIVLILVGVRVLYEWAD